MNKPNPLIPQGTFPDPRGRSHIRIAVFAILAVHVVLLTALLMAGCKKNADTDTGGDKAAAASTIYSNATPLPDATNGNLGAGAQTGALSAATSVAPTSSVPIPPPPTEVTSPSTTTEHVIVHGDSFYTLAKKYGVTMRAIADANSGVDSAKLKIGQKIKIPAPTAASATAATHTTANAAGAAGGDEKTYTVKSGDNLMKIAKVYGVSVKSLRSVNSLKTDQIKVGQKLKIPVKSPASIDSAAAATAAAVTATNLTP